MSKERRYSQKEIAAIFKQAALDFEQAQQKVQSGEGLTLSEIEEIGKEVGITPGFIASAAARVDRRLNAPREKKIAGLPIEVHRIVELPDSFSDEDWDRLVVDLHDTFNIVGTIQGDNNGRIRTWVTETVQVFVEPKGKGYRLKIISTNSLNVLFMLIGGVFTLVSLMFMVAVISKGKFMTEMDDTLFSLMLSAIGLGTAGLGAFRLPKWHKDESQKVEAIIARTIGDTAIDSVSTATDIEDKGRIKLDDLEADVESVHQTNRNGMKAK